MIWSLKTEQVIHALIVLPLEAARLSNSVDLSEQCTHSYRSFHAYHLGSAEEAARLVEAKEQAGTVLAQQLGQLEQLQAESGSKLSDR